MSAFLSWYPSYTLKRVLEELSLHEFVRLITEGMKRERDRLLLTTQLNYITAAAAQSGKSGQSAMRNLMSRLKNTGVEVSGEELLKRAEELQKEGKKDGPN